jgi:quinol monooxygenase YgiN
VQTGLGCSFCPKTSATFELDLIKLCILVSLQTQQRKNKMSVTVTADFPIKADRLEEFLGMMPAALIETRAFKGCESIRVHVEQNTSTLFMVNTWASRADTEAYIKWRTDTGFMDKIGAFFSGEPLIRFFDEHTEI